MLPLRFHPTGEEFDWSTSPRQSLSPSQVLDFSTTAVVSSKWVKPMWIWTLVPCGLYANFPYVFNGICRTRVVQFNPHVVKNTRSSFLVRDLQVPDFTVPSECHFTSSDTSASHFWLPRAVTLEVRWKATGVLWDIRNSRTVNSALIPESDSRGHSSTEHRTKEPWDGITAWQWHLKRPFSF